MCKAVLSISDLYTESEIASILEVPLTFAREVIQQNSQEVSNEQ